MRLGVTIVTSKQRRRSKMNSEECKKCFTGHLRFLEIFDVGVSEKWECEMDDCDAVVIVPITIERHFDHVDWDDAE
jgi:hypothetical protein